MNIAYQVLILSAVCLLLLMPPMVSQRADAATGTVTIAIGGDSTVADYKADDPLRGWGQLLPEFVDPTTATLVNFATPGRSTKTFKSEGRWDKVLASKPTYVLIQFGHNDSHAKARPESTDADTDYTEYLKGYVDSARAIGAIPVLVTPMHRATWGADNQLTPELLPYATAMRRVATDKSVPLIDLYRQSETLYQQIGKDQIDTIFAHAPKDHTHFNEKGARLLARIVAEQLAVLVPALKPAIVLAPK